MLAADPLTVTNGAELVTNLMPEIVLVPAPVIVKVPVMDGVLREEPSHAAIFTPGVMVTFSVTDDLKKMVSPTELSAMAAAKVVCVPLAALVSTIFAETP